MNIMMKLVKCIYEFSIASSSKWPLIFVALEQLMNVTSFFNCIVSTNETNWAIVFGETYQSVKKMNNDNSTNLSSCFLFEYKYTV